ncbi:MAG: twin-arginine translocase subunit TatC [Planctomycetes bacterium]|nr:twin-arginine translocase subunit TatC [Planctomycetota bacterium]
MLRFQALGPSDGLLMAMRMSFAFALFLSLPVWVGQVWSFVSPGLTPGEKRWLYLGLGSGGGLFIVGSGLAYFLGVPLALEFLLPFNQSLSGWKNSFTGTGYVDFVVTCCASFGLAFELPLVMLILGWFDILTPEVIREWWRAVVLIIVGVAAIMTPPDPVTQMLLAGPMLLLFLFGYWLVKWTRRDGKID